MPHSHNPEHEDHEPWVICPWNDPHCDEGWCGTSAYMKKYVEEHPEFKKIYIEKERESIKRLIEKRKNRLPNESHATGGNIAVYFHVLVSNPATVTDGDLAANIAALNTDFTSPSPGAWASVADDTNISFTWNATCRNDVTTNTIFGANDAIKSDASGGSDAHDPDHYLNIWIGTLGGGLLGYAQFPGGPPATDGVAITISSLLPPHGVHPFNMGRTLTHEVGHYLNLRHIWGDGPCSVDDFCSDTPAANGANYGCPTGTDSCPSLPGVDMIENFMDYTDDACMGLFTVDQGSRMDDCLQNTRSNLLPDPGACGTTTTPAPTTTTPTPTTPAPTTGCGGLDWPVNSMGTSLWALGFVDPTWYGNSDHTYGGHTGMDIGYDGPTSWNTNVEIIAAAGGKVIRVNDGEPDECDGTNFNTPQCGGGCAAGNCGGNYVVIDHDPTGALNLTQVFGYRYTSSVHMQTNSIVVAVGDTVSKGQKLGLMGSSGNSTGVHLHFEVGTSAGSGPFVGGTVDPFYSESGDGSNTVKSMWCDQCALPIYDNFFPYDGSGYGGLPVPTCATTTTTPQPPLPPGAGALLPCPTPPAVYYNGAKIGGDLTPFVSRTFDPIDYGDRWGMGETITLAGTITGLQGRAAGEATEGKALAALFNENFKELKIDQGGSVYMQWPSVKVESIEFPSDKWMEGSFIKYTVKLKAYNIFDVDEVLDPSDSYAFTENEDGTVDVTHKISAKGIKSGVLSAYDRAVTFVNKHVGVPHPGVCDPYWIVNKTPILLARSEQVNRLEGTYSVTENYKYQVDADNAYLKLDKISLSEGMSDEFNNINYEAEYITDDANGITSLRTVVNAEDFRQTVADQINTYFDPSVALQDVYQVSINIDEVELANKISIKGTYHTGINAYQDLASAGHLDYTVTFARDDIMGVGTYSIDGNLITPGGNYETKNHIIENWKTANQDNIENYLSNEIINSEVYSVYGATRSLNPVPQSLKWSQNTGKATLNIGGTFSDEDYNPTFANRTTKWNVTVDSSKDTIKLKPSANVKGVFVMQDLNCMSQARTSISAEAVPLHGDLEAATRNTEDTHNRVHNSMLTFAFAALTEESQGGSWQSPELYKYSSTWLHNATPDQGKIYSDAHISFAFNKASFVRRPGSKFGW